MSRASSRLLVAVGIVGVLLSVPVPAAIAGGLELSPRIDLKTAYKQCEDKARADWERDANGEYTGHLKGGYALSTSAMYATQRTMAHCLDALIRRVLPQIFDAETLAKKDPVAKYDQIAAVYGHLFDLIATENLNGQGETDAITMGIDSLVDFQEAVLEMVELKYNRHGGVRHPFR